MEIGRGREGYDAGLPSALVVAHELKSPLAVLRQLSLVLQDESITLTAAERAEYHRHLVLTADRALALVSDMALLPSLQPSLFPLEPLNPLAVVQQLAADMAPIVQLCQRSVMWPQRSTRSMVVLANRQLLLRVMSNFLDNALKYTDQATPVRVQVQQRADCVRLAVRDYGPVMSRQEYRRLTEELASVKTVRARPESSGLGVYVAAQFARAMQGHIGLVRHRQGVSFYVEVPLSRQMSLL